MSKKTKEPSSSRLTAYEKKLIIDHAENYPDTTHVRIAEMYSEKFQKKISRRSIKNFLDSKDKIIEAYKMNSETKKISETSKYNEINISLFNWIANIEARGGIYTGNLLKEKALMIAKEKDCLGFRASNGWLCKFNKKYGISLKTLSGEAANKGVEDYEDFYSVIKKKISEYPDENIYNCDETALFFKQAPSKSLVSKIRKGIKKYKDRITILFCTNLTGSHKLKPLVIGKSKNPRIFKNFNHEVLCEYKSNKSAWMTRKEFGDWLLEWDRKFKKENKKILLLLDNCPSHKIKFSLDSIELYFLPKNSTPITQPLDNGIIRNFKLKYFRFLTINALEKMNFTIDAEQAFKNFTLKDAILYLSWAWNDIKETTILNCWKNAGYTIDSNIIREEETVDLQYYIDKLDIIDPLDHNEFLEAIPENELIIELCEISNIDEQIKSSKFQAENDFFEEIFEMDKSSEREESENSDFKVFDAIKWHQSIKKYVMRDNKADKNIFSALNTIECYLNSKNKKKYAKITDYLIHETNKEN